jgi:hypothetical protein
MFSSFSDSIKKKGMKDFAEIFELGINFFHNRGA